MDGESYLLNIGNTRSAVASGVFPDGVSIDYYPTARLVEEWRPTDRQPEITASCVVPAVRQALEQRFGQCIHFIGPADYPELDFSCYDPGTLGSDRLANAAAAHALLPDSPVLVFDCGTALNSVAVDGRGRFHGGVILPGRETALRALAKSTALLPEYAVDAPHRLEPLARDTRNAILNGVDIGILGAAEAIVRRTRQCPPFAGCTVWFTGGDAEFFVKYLPEELNVALAPVPLTLYGVQLAAQRRRGG